MLRRSFLKTLTGICLSSSALAGSLNVAVDIAPVHSLVAQVMDGVAEPDLLIQPEASPHSYTLRPSEAQALSQADVVFWVSEGLTPWLEKSLETLASHAQKVEMVEVGGTTTYDFREGATFETHNHSDDERHHEDVHEKQVEEGDTDHDEHAHEGKDPHAWLDPANAKVWLKKIRDVLVENDPEHASTYQHNTTSALARLDLQIDRIHKETQKMSQLQFIVFHDAYQYFERRFGVLAAGSISMGDAQDPSPARISEIHALVSKLGIRCIYTEPQYNPGLVNNVFEGTNVQTIGVMDPLGANINAGKDQYEQLLNSMLSSLKQCQSGIK